MDKERKEQLIIKICCVIAAFALWLFITGTENPLTSYKLQNVPVKLLNTDVLTRANLVLVPGQDLTTSLNIKGANTSILLAKKAEDFTVVADLSAYGPRSATTVKSDAFLFKSKLVLAPLIFNDVVKSCPGAKTRLALVNTSVFKIFTGIFLIL